MCLYCSQNIQLSIGWRRFVEDTHTLSIWGRMRLVYVNWTYSISSSECVEDVVFEPYLKLISKKLGINCARCLRKLLSLSLSLQCILCTHTQPWYTVRCDSTRYLFKWTKKYSDYGFLTIVAYDLRISLFTIKQRFRTAWLPRFFLVVVQTRRRYGILSILKCRESGGDWIFWIHSMYYIHYLIYINISLCTSCLP